MGVIVTMVVAVTMGMGMTMGMVVSMLMIMLVVMTITSPGLAFLLPMMVMPLMVVVPLCFATSLFRVGVAMAMGVVTMVMRTTGILVSAQDKPCADGCQNQQADPAD